MTDLSNQIEKVAVGVGYVGRTTSVCFTEVVDRGVDTLERGLTEVKVGIGRLGASLARNISMANMGGKMAYSTDRCQENERLLQITETLNLSLIDPTRQVADKRMEIF